MMIRLALAACLVGCATTSVPTAEALPVPASRILNAGFVQPAAGAFAITIKRDAGMNTGACGTKVWINGAPVAEVRTAEKVVVYLKPGSYMLGAETNLPCAGRLAELQMIVGPSHPTTYRMGYGTSGEFALSPSAF
jgi:hypothetical protein